jgi:carbon storage regulator CsrA
MLVLSRKPGEEFRIGDIVIKVIATATGRAKLGITAPADQQILRGEVWEENQKREQSAMSHECLNEQQIEEARRLDEQCRGRLAEEAAEKELRDQELELLRRRMAGRIERGEVLNEDER